MGMTREERIQEYVKDIEWVMQKLTTSSPVLSNAQKPDIECWVDNYKQGLEIEIPGMHNAGTRMYVSRALDALVEFVKMP